MPEPVDLRHDRHWRTAVWALRVGYAGLAVVAVGLVALWSGATPWLLAAGVVVWLASAAVTSVGAVWARHDLPEPRPGYWSLRLMLIRDTVHARSPVGRP